MRILNKNVKDFLKLSPESLEDLILLDELISSDDFVKGETYRKINLAKSGEKSNIVKKKYFVVLKVLKTELNEDSQILKINGTVENEIDDVPKGSAQSLNINTGYVFYLSKDWQKYEIKILEDSTRKKHHFLIVAFDRDNAIFASLSGNRKEILLSLKSNSKKKLYEEQNTENFFKTIVLTAKDYLSKGFETVIFASPNFWKRYVEEFVDSEMDKKTIYCAVSSGDESGVEEALKRPEMKSALEKSNYAVEEKLIEKLNFLIAKELAIYGFKDVKTAVEIGAVLKLLVSKNKLKDFEVRNLIKLAESLSSEVKIISSKKSVKLLDNLGGVAGFLRYKLNSV